LPSIIEKAAGDPGGKRVAVGHRVQRQKTAEAPAADSDPFWVHPAIGLQPLDSGQHIFGLNFADAPMDRPRIGQAAAAAGTVVDHQHADSFAGKHLVQQVA
jgi:hypothetical protein